MMPSNDLAFFTIAEAGRLIKDRKLSPVELVTATLGQIERFNSKLNAYITVVGAEALEAARQAEKEIASGQYRGPLHGIPFSIKDLFYTKGIRTTGGSAILKEWVPDFDATLVERLKSAGAIILGKAHTAEFACGATGLNHHFGPARNPWNAAHVPGGSSSGSAISVATGMALGSLGSDTGGSVRIPAALCGVTGLKPTYGLVSRHGILPLSWSLDTPGPITRTAEDAALVLQAIAGRDGHDSSTANTEVPEYATAMLGEMRGIQVGVPEDVWGMVNEEVCNLTWQALELLEDLGATLHRVPLPLLKYAGAVGSLISWSEGSSWHEEWVRTRPQDYGPEPLRRFRLGLLLQSTHYFRAQRVRTLIVREVSEALERVDVIVSPTTAIAAPPIGEQTAPIGGKPESVLQLLSSLTRPYNLAGMPAISVCCGFTASGLPVGLQIAGRRFDDMTLLRMAHGYQRVTQWHTNHPPPIGQD